MTGSQTISEIYKGQKKSFLAHLNSAKSLEEETIHKLRVNVKRLRSLLKFLNILSEEKFNKKKLVKLVLPIFKSAGKIRATTLNIKLTKVYRSKAILDFKVYLKEKEKREKKFFLKKIKKFHKGKFKKFHKQIVTVFKHADQKLVSQKCKEYVKIIFSKIHADMPNINSDENFHDVRKKLKDIKTISELLGNITARKKLLPGQKKVVSIEERIGKWHDTVTLVEELERYIKSPVNINANEAEKNKKNKDNETLSILVLNLKARNEVSKKLISGQLKKKLF